MEYEDDLDASDDDTTVLVKEPPAEDPADDIVGEGEPVTDDDPYGAANLYADEQVALAEARASLDESPQPITPDTPTDAAQRRIGLERQVNGAWDAFKESSHVAFIDHALAGREVRLVAYVDGVEYDPDSED